MHHPTIGPECPARQLFGFPHIEQPPRLVRAARTVYNPQDLSIARHAHGYECPECRLRLTCEIEHRSDADWLSCLNPDGTARRGTYLIAPGGEVVWQHVDCEQAAHHVEEAMAALRQNAPQQPTGAISGDFGAMVVSEAPAAANQPTAAQRRYLVREQEESYR